MRRSIMALSITIKFTIMTFNTIKFSIMTLRVMTLCISTLIQNATMDNSIWNIYAWLGQTKLYCVLP
jgi:Cu/Ag efflux pump CusA